MSSLFEIIETSSGEIVLKRADDESAPLIKINFSEEALEYLGEMKSEVGRAMISAGVQTVGNLYDQEDNGSEQETRTIH
ncbi:MAG TPA: hypothetical protein VIM85_09465 [Pseudomonadales bacterium]